MGQAKRLNTRAAAQHVGMSPSFLEKARTYGGGPLFLKLGKKVVYEITALDAWLAARRMDRTPSTGSRCRASGRRLRNDTPASQRVAA